MFKKLKDKKGFTLVELIVVLVILAILTALLVPSLTGYINRAKKQELISQTRMVLMAANAELGIADGENTTIAPATDTADAATTDTVLKGIIENAELTRDYGYTITVQKADNYKVATIVLTDGSKYCKYDAATGEYTSSVDDKTLTSGATAGTFAIAIQS